MSEKGRGELQAIVLHLGPTNCVYISLENSLSNLKNVPHIVCLSFVSLQLAFLYSKLWK